MRTIPLWKAILAILGLALSLNAQTWGRSVFKVAGETIQISWIYPAELEGKITGFSVYRQAGVTGAPVCVATAPPSGREIVLTMPAGTTQQYRFRVMAVVGISISPAGPEVIVNRRK